MANVLIFKHIHCLRSSEQRKFTDRNNNGWGSRFNGILYGFECVWSALQHNADDRNWNGTCNEIIMYTEARQIYSTGIWKETSGGVNKDKSYCSHN